MGLATRSLQCIQSVYSAQDSIDFPWIDLNEWLHLNKPLITKLWEDEITFEFLQKSEDLSVQIGEIYMRRIVNSVICYLYQVTSDSMRAFYLVIDRSEDASYSVLKISSCNNMNCPKCSVVTKLDQIPECLNLVESAVMQHGGALVAYSGREGCNLVEIIFPSKNHIPLRS
ncbi:MAG: hypothetical protein AAF558_10730 [Verrucomicrobiota bacterium]